MSDIVLVERDGPLVILTLNDPERANPLSAGLVEALTAVLEATAEDPAVRAVIVTGAGRNFSAGADLAALERLAAGGDLDVNCADSERLRRLFETLLGHPKLTVAAVRGAAVAGGCGLATACDLVVAERSARFAYTEVKIGFVAAVVLTFLTRRVRGNLARQLLLDPELMSAERACEVGLVDLVVDDGSAVVAARERALAIAAKAAPSAIAATKRLLNDVVGLDWRAALAVAAEANVAQRLAPDCRRGVRAFLAAKRTPDWLAEDGGD